MKRTYRRVIATALVLILGACNAGASGGTLPGPGAIPGTANGSGKHKLKARIRIVIPKRKHRRRRLIHGRYVSPATQSIAISITPQGGGTAQNFNANLTTASNPNCSTSLAQPLICTVTVTLAPGNYTGTFATYDRVLDAYNNPQGNELSGNQSVPFEFIAGRDNQINVTLDGIATQVVLVPDWDDSLSGNMASGYTLGKCSSAPQNVSVFGVDADRNYILGAGAPVPGLASNDSTNLPVTATPSPYAPNRFTLTPPAVATANAVVQLTATVQQATPGSGTGSGVADPPPANVNVTFGSAICGVFKEYPIANFQPRIITAGPDGALWFTSSAVNKIGRITTGGSITKYTLSTNSRAYGIVAGSDGALWFADTGTNQIGRITTGGSVTEYAIPTGSSSPQGITAGPDGALWFTESVGNKIGQITTGGAFNEYPIPTASSSPQRIAAGPDGALWFTERCGNNIGRITTGGSVTEYPIPTASSLPSGITAGPDGAMWFLETGSNNIGRIGLADSFTEFNIFPAGQGHIQPYNIVAGPDGALWLTFGNADGIGQITTGFSFGEIHVYPYTSNPIDFGITLGPDDALWFTELNGNEIVQLQ